MRVLNLTTDTLDQTNTFKIEYKNFRGITSTLKATVHEISAGEPFIIKSSTIIKDSYTEADYAETYRLEAEEPVRDGDIVIVTGRQYRVKVNGNYLDPAVLIPVA